MWRGEREARQLAAPMFALCCDGRAAGMRVAGAFAASAGPEVGP